jgi:hypothetical protein
MEDAVAGLLAPGGKVAVEMWAYAEPALIARRTWGSLSGVPPSRVRHRCPGQQRTFGRA